MLIYKNMYQSLVYVKHIHFLSLNSSAKPREDNSPWFLHYSLLKAQSYKIKNGESTESFDIKMKFKWKYLSFVDITAMLAGIDFKDHLHIVQAI